MTCFDRGQRPGRVTAVGHRAVLEDHRRAGQVEDPVHLLLDHQQGGARPVDLPQALVDGVDDHRRQPERDLVGHQQAGGEHQDLGQREHALLAAGQGPPVLAAALAQHREGLVGPGQRVGHALATPSLAEDQPQVLLHGQAGEHPPALGHVGRPGPGDLVGGQAGDVLAAQPDGAGGAGQQAGHHPGHRRLAGAVGADQGGHPAAGHRKGDVEQGPVGPVAGADVVDLEGRRCRSPARRSARRVPGRRPPWLTRSAPDRPGGPTASAITSSKVPSAMTAPRFITMVRSTTEATMLRSCSTSRTAMPRSRWSIRRTWDSSRVSWMSRPEDGSSASSSTGSATRARASSTRRHEPEPEGRDRGVGLVLDAHQLEHRGDPSGSPRWWCAAVAQVLPQPTLATGGPARPPAGGRARSCRGRSRPAGRSGRCPGAPACRWAARAARCPASSTLPRCGLELPADAVEQRGLAGSVGPDQPDALARVDLEADAVDGGDPAERLGDVVHPEQRVAVSHGRHRPRLRRRPGGRVPPPLAGPPPPPPKAPRRAPPGARRRLAGVEDQPLHAHGPAPLLELEDPFRMGGIGDGAEGEEHEDQAVAAEAGRAGRSGAAG